jgi:hypothetical protein
MNAGIPLVRGVKVAKTKSPFKDNSFKMKNPKKLKENY